MARLRDALLTQTYARAGTTYHPDWAFHQLARGWFLGAPLSGSYLVAAGADQYAIQVYATDTLYNVVPNWSDVRRLSALTAARPAILGEQPAEALLTDDAQLEPAPAPFHILQYAPATAAPAAFGPRYGSKIRLIVLHADTAPAQASLVAMTAVGAPAMPHYYVASDGAIYQLLDDNYAAWHAGIAIWNGRRQNINRISLGVVAERGPRGYTAELLAALAWLCRTLAARYGLPPGAIVRWGDLDPRHADDPAGFPWEQFEARMQNAK
jgi:hypothetical protein